MNCAHLNCKRFGIAVIAVFVFIFIFEMVFHGMLLGETYKTTAQLWRPESEMEAYMPWMLGGQLLFSVMFCYIYTFAAKCTGMMEGVRYGLLIGLLMASTNIIFYSVQPLPLDLVVIWIVGGLLETALAGALMASIYKPDAYA